MKANELRIGNYIKYPNLIRPIQVSIIDTTETTTDTKAEPIPLTEEWLLKFGFELKHLVNGKVLSYKNKSLSISFNTENIILSVHIGIQRIDEEKIKYVHQLQNLYFVLTGEELKVKQEIENLDL